MAEPRAESASRSGRWRDLLVTLALVALAAVLATLAALNEPSARTPSVLSDLGQPFSPGFHDPTQVAAIEIIGYDEATAAALPLKVELRRGRFVISSHHDYPAAAKDRLSEAAAALVDLKREILRSVSVADHETFGVVDPLDASHPGLAGRGRRVTLRDASGRTLTDLILGKEVEGKPGYRSVRVPGEKNTYAARLEVEPSARFQDWVASDVLQLAAADIRKITILSYSVDEMFGGLREMERTVLTRDANAGWTIDGGGALRKNRVERMARVLANLGIVDVAAKPEELARDLVKGGIAPTMDTLVSLQHKGFFVSPNGRLLANEGELRVETRKGVVYTLRFGEIAPGGDLGELPPAPQHPSPTGAAPAASPVPTPTPVPPEKARRYLFVSAHALTAPVAGQEEAQAADPAAQRLAERLNRRFADWYYVISGADFAKLRLRRSDLVR